MIGTECVGCTSPSFGWLQLPSLEAAPNIQVRVETSDRSRTVLRKPGIV